MARKTRKVKMHPKQRDDLDFTMKAKCEQLSASFHQLKVETHEDILKLNGQVVGALWDDIGDDKKANVMLKGLGLAASLHKDYMNLDFPEEIIRQFNEKIEEQKAAIIKAHNELLCPECFKKVSQKLGWVKKSTA